MAKQDDKTVGAQIPDRLFQLLNLHSLKEGVSKSQIIRDSLLLWLEENEVEIEELIKRIAQNYHARWLRLKSRHGEVSFQEYKEKTADQLQRKSIDENLVQKIIEQI